MLNTCFATGSSEFGYVLGMGECLYDQSLIKMLGTESLTSFADWQHFTCLSQKFAAGKIKCIMYDFTGRELWKLVPGFPWTLTFTPFPFADIALYPSAVINHSQEYDSAESCETSLRIIKPKDGLGDLLKTRFLDTNNYWCLRPHIKWGFIYQ